VSGNGIDGSAALAGNALHVPAEPLSYDQTPVGTVLSQLYDDGLRREGTVTKVYSQTQKFATWRKVSLTEGGQSEWDTASRTEDGELRTMLVRSRDGEPASAPMAIAGVPVPQKIGNLRKHPSAPLPASTYDSKSPGTRRAVCTLTSRPSSPTQKRPALIIFMSPSKYNPLAQELATYSPHRYRPWQQ
jgi:hypothetical protein